MKADDGSGAYNGKYYLTGSNVLTDGTGATLPAYVTYSYDSTNGLKLGTLYTDADFTQTVESASVIGTSEISLNGATYTFTAGSYSDVTISSAEAVEITKAIIGVQSPNESIRVYYTDDEANGNVNNLYRTSYDGTSATILAGYDDNDPYKGQNTGTSPQTFTFGNEIYATTIVGGNVTAIQKQGTTSETSVEAISAYTVESETTSAITFSDTTKGITLTATSDTALSITLNGSTYSLTDTVSIDGLDYTFNFVDTTNNGLTTDDTVELITAGGEESVIGGSCIATLVPSGTTRLREGKEKRGIEVLRY